MNIIRSFTAAACCAALLSAGVRAQASDPSGTWKLNRTATQSVAGVGLAGLDRGGTPNSLYVTLAANGSVTVGSDHNQGSARLYMIGGESVIPAAPSGTVTVRTRSEGRTLLVESTGTGPALKETWTLSADNQTLTIAVSLGGAEALKTSTLVYTRTLSESPCTQWPTPCRENRAGR